MDLLISTLSKHKDIWLKDQIENQSSIYGFILNYIYTTNKLRKPQTESIETYLYLRSTLGNKSILDGIKSNNIVFEDKRLTSNLLNFCENLLLEFQTKKLLSSDQLMNFRNSLFKEPEKFIDQLFDGLGDLNYQIYSLPMGAGKTYLMASLIYLELYLSRQQNDGAKNFLITIPNAKKTSILNSLKTIRKFDPTWILPENEALKLYQIITERFIVLDQAKANKNSNTTENPNVAKIQSLLALGQNLEGLVVIVNAEKVILDQIDKINSQAIFDEEEKEKASRANELRYKLSQIPNLMVLMDEVHHNQDKENLLNSRFIHGSLKQSGNLVRVLGFTGTPYFSQTLDLQGFKLKINQIPSTVYHYSLANGISKFLKKPVIKEKIGLNSKELVKSGLEEFFQKYNFNYNDGRSTKLAIYCTSIENLKLQILPVVQEFYKSTNRDFDEVFYFHTDTKDFKCPKEYALEFENFDDKESTKRIVLLVGIGTEGWDCQSLTGVIFSNESKSSNIKVLQSVCRCLREVENASKESGLIVLNTHNKQYLEDELQKQHNIKLQDFTDPKGEKVPTRINRVNELGLPKIQINQFQTRFIESKSKEIIPKTKQVLKEILESLEARFIQENTIEITENGLETGPNTEIKTGNIGNPAHFDYWLLDIVKYSLGEIIIENLESFETDLKAIYSKVTISKDRTIFYNLNYNQIEVKTSIIKAFIPYNQELQTELYTENIDIDWLITGFDEKPLIKFENSKFDPDNWQKAFEIKIDENIDLQISDLEKSIENSPSLKDLLESQLELLKNKKNTLNTYNHSYHYAPYDFKDSKDELEVYQKLVNNQELQEAGLECYYSGDRFLSNFKINTYKKTGSNWKLIRPYTPDFIALKRDNQNKIISIVIIETKGRQDDTDKDISNFMSKEFVKANPHIKYHYSLSESYQDTNHRFNTIKNFILENLK